MGRDMTGYQHWVPPAKLDPDFRSKLKYVTVESCQQLIQIIKQQKSHYIAWDLETSSLNPEEGFIVGVALSWDATTGYYVPINHYQDTSLGYTALAIIYKVLMAAKMTFGYNIRFDMRFYEFESKRALYALSLMNIDDEKRVKMEIQYTWCFEHLHYFDVQDSVWLADTNKKLPSLKWSEEHFLGWKADTFSDTLGEQENFHYVPVKDATQYAGQDSIGTFALALETMKYYQESRQSGRLDQEALYPLMKWEETPIELDREYLQTLKTETYQHLKELEHEIYKIAGTVFKINSNRDVTEVFERLGIDTGQRIASGYMKVTLPILSNMMIMGNNHPILKLLVEYKKEFKQINSYIDPLLKVAESDRGFARFAYQTTNVPCLTENNRVVIQGKGMIPISEVVAGDMIWTQYGWKRVLWNDSHYSEEIMRVEFTHGEFIEGTFKHPVLTVDYDYSEDSKTWVWLSELDESDYVVREDKRLTHPVKKEILPGAIVYDIEVEDVHEYVANGIVTHNTGRLSAGKDGKNSFYSPINVQSIPKPNPKMWYCREATEDEIRDKKDILGWMFSLTEKTDKMIEGFDPVRNPRRAFICHRPDARWVSMDMSSEELRIVANLFSEPTWTKAFLTGGDIHKETAITIWGAENYDKKKRKIAKTCFSENEWFYTSEGPVRGRDLENKIVLGLEGQPQKSRFFYEERDGYQVELSNGQVVEVTSDHKLPMADKRDLEYEQVSESLVGRSVYMEGLNSFGPYQFITLQKDKFHEEESFVFDEGLAYLVAYILGDGSVGFDKRVNLYTNVSCLAQRDNHDYLVLVLSRFGHVSDQDGGKKVKLDGYGALTLSSRRFAKWFVDNCGHTQFKRVPEIVYRSPRSVMLAFLAGFIDSDGKSNSTALLLQNTNATLLSGFVSILTFLGIQSRWGYENVKVKGAKDKCFYIRLFGCSSCREIPLLLSNKKEALLKKTGKNVSFPILEEERSKFEGIGRYEVNVDNFLKGKSKRLSQRTASIMEDYRQTGFSVQVQSVIPCRVRAVVMETETHYYRASGIRSHNCNFGLIYGMSASSFIQKHPEVTVDQAEQFISDFKKGLPNIFAGQDRMIRQAKKTGTVYNVFGRPRRVKFYLHHPDKRKRGFGQRTVRNAPVQSVGGDVLKLIFIRSWKQFFADGKNKDWDIAWRSTIHDEVNWSVPYDKLRSFIEIMTKLMTVKIPGWPIPLVNGLEVGHDWGTTFPFNYNVETGEMVPDYSEVPKEEENAQPEEPEVEEDFSDIFWEEDAPFDEE